MDEPRPDETVTNRVTGEETPEDVPAEAAQRAAEAERRIRDQHAAGEPDDRPISES